MQKILAYIIEKLDHLVLKLDVWYTVKYGKKYHSVDELMKDLKLEDDYETNYSHSHCPIKNSPCGIEGKHRCCICKKEYD